MNIQIKETVDKLTQVDVANRLNFNAFTEAEFNSFKQNFSEETEGDKINFLIRIVEEIDENFLLEGNFKEFFDDESIKDLLRKCL